jgi:hypothetical protein
MKIHVKYNDKRRHEIKKKTMEFMLKIKKTNIFKKSRFNLKKIIKIK